MQLTLFVPGLLLPDEVRSDTVFDLTAPTLSRLLGRAHRIDLPPDWLAHAFGLASPLPVAALRKVGAGETAEGDWLCLDPVHWQVNREGIRFAAPDRLALTAAEATALVEAVQPLFAAWGELSASTPLHWELHLARPLQLDTRPLPECIGLPVDPTLPAGADGREWRRLLAEAQTILHAHPVNQQREACGQSRVSSLWPWGAGSLPERIQRNFDVVWSHDPLLAGLGLHANLPCLRPPDRFLPASGRVLCHFDKFSGPARALDALAWRNALLGFEQDWLIPAIAALRRGECSRLQLVGTGLHGAQKTLMYALVRRDWWRFWRRPLPLTALG
jgi:hypothetical protein